ncbi:MAG: signal peptide peptidase SppA [Thermogutta sp.]|nr:signal peptide peptidase SppA [Thermogutta sp.]HPU07191.1 signal peptide peptidase SppA [Thermogutta sp.]HPZ82784.1 signal peptide peptidase SppA [Thermogutta sp.]HQF12884.1 signal peptide peptidase SppA [Thermogutta sp.]
MSHPSSGEGIIQAEVLAVEPAHRKSVFWRVLKVLIGLLVIVTLFVSLLLNMFFIGTLGLDGMGSKKVREKYFSHSRFARDKVVIMPLEGLILDGDGFMKRQIDQVIEDETVKAVVLRVNSPGGTVSGSHAIYHYLKKMCEKRKIPLVVSMGAIAASGGYYVSMAVGDTPKSIYAEPTTWTGSIGVIIPHYDAAELAQKIGIKEDSVASHPLKGMGSMLRPMTEEERAIFQGLVDESFNRFKEVVKSGRPKFRQQPELLDKLATGQVFPAEQAKAEGLVDEIGFLEDAVDRAIELANLDPDNVRVVKYEKELTLMDVLLGETVQVHIGPAGMDWKSLLEWSVPRAYYLFYQGPVLIQSGLR